MISLKSELFKKQKEFAEEKSRNSTTGHGKSSTSSGSKVLPWMKKNKGVEERNNRDMSEVLEKDKNDQVRAILEAKSKLYNKMTSGDIIADSEDTQEFLVDFEQKSIDAWREKKEKNSDTKTPETKAKISSTIKETIEDAKDQWMEYVDSLGRTRTCLKEELPSLQRLDKKLDLTTSENKTLMSDDMRREEERQRWEKEALQEQDELHYENLRFGEIRELGVGYYAFSSDQEKREDQMKRLHQLRQETEAQKQTNEAKKVKQQTALAARLEKVRQRRIKKLKDQGKEIPVSLLDPIKVEPPKLQEVPKVLESNIEDTTLEKAACASTKTREWDKEKVEWKPARAPQQPRSWTDPRDERPSEFAPPSSYYPPTTKAAIKTSERSSSHKSEFCEQLPHTTVNLTSNIPTKRHHGIDDPHQNIKHKKEPDDGSMNPLPNTTSSSLSDEDRIQRLLQTVSSSTPAEDKIKSPSVSEAPSLAPYVSHNKPITLKIVPKPSKNLTTKSAFN